MINHSNISFIITTFKSENIIEKLLSNLLILNFLKYFLSFSNFKKKKNKFRFLGLLNSILLNKSFHRPNQNKIKRRDGRVV